MTFLQAISTGYITKELAATHSTKEQVAVGDPEPATVNAPAAVPRRERGVLPATAFVLTDFAQPGAVAFPDSAQPAVASFPDSVPLAAVASAAFAQSAAALPAALQRFLQSQHRRHDHLRGLPAPAQINRQQPSTPRLRDCSFSFFYPFVTELPLCNDQRIYKRLVDNFFWRQICR
jgi:hypothetical protein